MNGKLKVVFSAVALSSVLAACGNGAASSAASSPATTSSPTTTSIGGTVKVAYAGSLVGAMVQKIGPAFQKATGVTFSGLPGGSTGLVNQIKSGTSSFDVFISAARSANDPLMGAANKNLETWYAALGTAPLVIGYNPSSSFAPALKSQKWYTVLAKPGIKIGRTDPAIDPKGKLTLELFAKESAILGNPSLTSSILGAAENPAQVFPEEALVSRLTSGQLDVGFFYSNEAAFAKIPTVPTGLNLGANFTISILTGAPDSAQAVAFVNFLYSPEGQKLLKEVGLVPESPTVTGSLAKAPKGLAL
ncbi:extracellular solute-binding protein [Acidithrix ferrooxidans]|uniref:Molybdate ABC transporter periplasmic substrate-binding protein n=1 Tax=Acidithrix ferrooxidans TaxID=1280514 RepID=A0A0D8HI54_9ACTN|nr:extracellular solute-binding protein [Acidithrix ferrooxidans]KJF17670.1 molybdate ABC transporter periplasmic substrate-binding protein [Acidithrix ferrooxidans]